MASSSTCAHCDGVIAQTKVFYEAADVTVLSHPGCIITMLECCHRNFHAACLAEALVEQSKEASTQDDIRTRQVRRPEAHLGESDLTPSCPSCGLQDGYNLTKIAHALLCDLKDDFDEVQTLSVEEKNKFKNNSNYWCDRENEKESARMSQVLEEDSEDDSEDDWADILATTNRACVFQDSPEGHIHGRNHRTSTYWVRLRSGQIMKCHVLRRRARLGFRRFESHDW